MRERIVSTEKKWSIVNGWKGWNCIVGLYSMCALIMK